jgi:integrase/recombinase XerD
MLLFCSSQPHRPIAWRDELAHRGLGGATIRHRLASLASLFEYLCEKNAATHNRVKGVERPRTESGEGKTPAIGDHQARALLAAPAADTIKSKRDRAILSTLLFHALRREELCKLKVKDSRHARKGVPHLKISGKGGKTRYLPLHPGTHALIHDYLDAAGHGTDENGALFRPTRNNRTGRLVDAITADGVYKLVRGYSAVLGFEIGAHALRATAATNALDHQADIAKVQEWLGHANIATMRIYDHNLIRCLVSRRNASRVAIDNRMPDLPFSPRSSLMPQRSATRRITPSDMWVLRLSQTTCHGAAGAVANKPFRNATKSASVRVSPMLPRTLPRATSNAAIRAFVPWRIYSNSRRSTCPGFIGRLLAARSSAWIPVISSIETVCTPCPAGGRGRLIHRADIGALRIEVGIWLGRQPVTVAVWLEIGLFFKKRPTEPCEILLTMPRATACRASSLWLQ